MNPRIYLLALGAFAFGTDVFVMAGVLPAIAHDQHVSIDAVGLLVTVFSLVYAFGAPFLSVLTSQISRRRLLMGVLLGFGVANILSALSPTFPLLLATRVVAACCAALYTPTASAVATTVTSIEQRGQALALVLGGLTISTVLGVPAGTWIGLHFGWPATFIFIAVLAGIAFLSLLLLGIPGVAMPLAISLKARLAPLTQPRMLFALLPTMLWTLGGFTFYTYIAFFLRQISHIPDPSGLLLIYGLGSVLGNWLGGYAVDRYGTTRPIALGLLVLIFTFVTLPIVATSMVGTTIALGILGTAGLVLFTPQQYRLISLVPAIPTLLIALNSSMIYLGIATGAGVGSLVLASAPVSTLPLVATVFLLAALLVFWLSTRMVIVPLSEKPGGAATSSNTAGNSSDETEYQMIRRSSD